ncbi:uncharacterized protein EURHEDRAFT_374021 [Aspergillus ruber CBS 135680]|uniref:Uncharacterized protein n=1 Tax=Aspergillus ruber (strain CBS 135680) TaxID=1388766 RepID=A0A017SQS8_ASPRC|nr:uncharacterized protein EURHEDRAFT_374021 [Aspergillus ruber CBS 135680]EYE98944.1 hypothetical protein EURHEDRAFT_374021 [Aspergillus ruber CBS 135680]
MPPRRKNQRSQGNNLFINAHPSPDKKHWRRRENSSNNRLPGPNDMATGDFYYPNNSSSHAMQFPSPGHPGGHPDNAFGPPGHPGPAPYQPYYGPGGNVWTSERPFALEQAEAQMLDMVAREEELKDQEKRLFLEEYRYVGRQTQYEPPHVDADEFEPTPDEPEIEPESKPLNTGNGNSVESAYGIVSETGRGGNTASKGAGFKLRGDAPEFVPMNKKSQGRKRQDSVTIVTSWY